MKPPLYKFILSTLALIGAVVLIFGCSETIGTEPKPVTVDQIGELVLEEEPETVIPLSTFTKTSALEPENIQQEPKIDRASEEVEGPYASLEQGLKVHFIYVGQGDSIFIEITDGPNILIDGGPRSAGDSVVAYLNSLGKTKLDIVIGTHPHEDHIGGLIPVLNAFEVENLMDPGVAHTTKTYQEYLNVILSKNINFLVPAAGTVFDLKNGARMEILGPITPSEQDLNNSSLVVKLVYGDIAFLFMGDAEQELEGQILKRGAGLDSDILKVGHHGSQTSSSPGLLRAVDPDIAVISCGIENRYGHPHSATLKNLTDLGIAIYRTDLSGDIIIISDGKTYDVIRGSPYSYPEAIPLGVEDPVFLEESRQEKSPVQEQFIGSKNSDVYHKPGCGHVDRIKEENKVFFSSQDDAESKGYRPCNTCKP